MPRPGLAPSRANALESRHVAVEIVPGGGWVLIHRPPQETVLAMRFQEAQHIVERILGPLGDLTANGTLTRVAVPARPIFALKKALKKADRLLDALAERPLSCRQIEHLLGISPRERIAWTKDGRLPTSGRSNISRGGQTLLLPTFPVKDILDLRRNPELIAAWRGEARE